MTSNHWFILAGFAALAIVLIGIGPFAGYLVTRHRRREVERAMRAETVTFFSPEPHEPARAATTRRELPEIQVFGMNRSRVLNLDVAVPVVASLGRHSADGARPSVTETFARATSGVADDVVDAELVRIDPLEDTMSIDMAELVELTEAERAFAADPLNSWCHPIDVEFAHTPLAAEAMAFLIEEERLSGAGVDVDAEWKSWNLTSMPIGVDDAALTTSVVLLGAGV